MVPPIHLGAWSMALMLWLPFELLLLLLLHGFGIDFSSLAEAVMVSVVITCIYRLDQRNDSQFVLSVAAPNNKMIPEPTSFAQVYIAIYKAQLLRC